jgi:hypothetical protein
MVTKFIPIRDQLAADIKRLTRLTKGNGVAPERRERLLDALHAKRVTLERIAKSC